MLIAVQSKLFAPDILLLNTEYSVTGLMFSDDTKESVLVSAGYQDKDYLVLKFNLDELIDSLVVVEKC